MLDLVDDGGPDIGTIVILTTPAPAMAFQMCGADSTIHAASQGLCMSLFFFDRLARWIALQTLVGTHESHV